MSRTPSRNRHDLESLIGPRGNTAVSNSNRPLLRQWLTACGVSSAVACNARINELSHAYNDTNDDGLNALRKQSEAHAQADKDNAPSHDDNAPSHDDNASESQAQQCVEKDAPEMPARETSKDNATKDNAMTHEKSEVERALEILTGALGKSGLDANAVREIVREELPGLIPVTRIEIKAPSGDVKTHGPAMHHKQLPELILCLLQGLNVALVGPAGSGKTTAVEQATAIIESDFYIQGAVQGAHDLLGYEDGHGKYHRTPTRDAFEHGGVVCWDEMDAGDPAGMLVANSATANGYMAFPDQARPVLKHHKFQAVANMNTFGLGPDRLYVGRAQMDAATLDRFFFIEWGYDEILERAIAGNDKWTARVQSLRNAAQKEKARMVISPRASIHGAKLLAAGMAWNRVEEGTIWRGCDMELRRRIEAAAI